MPKLERIIVVSKGVALLIALSALLILVLILIITIRTSRVRKCSGVILSASADLNSLGLTLLEKISEAYDAPEVVRAKYMLTAFEEVVKKFRSNAVFQERFIADVNEVHENLIDKLRDQVPGLSHSQLLLFACLLQGFSYRTISVLMGKKRQYIYDRRWNLRHPCIDGLRRCRGFAVAEIR